MARCADRIDPECGFCALPRHISSRSLRFWSLSFLALSIYLATAGLSIHFRAEFPASHPLRLALSCMSLVAAYIQVALLIVGTLSVWRPRSWSRRRIVEALVLAILVGLFSGLAFAFDPSHVQERFFVRVGLRHLITGVAALAMGLAVARRWPQGRFGQNLTAIALIIYGIDLLHVFTTYVVLVNGGTVWPWLRYTAVLSLPTQLFIGYGLVIWLLEDERERAEHATDAAARLRHFDALTGLPNRQYMLEHLERQMQNPYGAALMLVRVDNLGNVAAAFGMDGVDLALATTAERIEEVARARGLFAARPDADHFALQGAGIGAEAGAGRIAEEVPMHSRDRVLEWSRTCA